MQTNKRPPITNSQYKAGVKNVWRLREAQYRAHLLAGRYELAKLFRPGPKPRFRRGTAHLAYLGKSGQVAGRDIERQLMRAQMVLQGGQAI